MEDLVLPPWARGDLSGGALGVIGGSGKNRKLSFVLNRFSLYLQNKPVFTLEKKTGTLVFLVLSKRWFHYGWRLYAGLIAPKKGLPSLIAAASSPLNGYVEIGLHEKGFISSGKFCIESVNVKDYSFAAKEFGFKDSGGIFSIYPAQNFAYVEILASQIACKNEVLNSLPAPPDGKTAFEFYLSFAQKTLSLLGLKRETPFSASFLGQGYWGEAERSYTPLQALKTVIKHALTGQLWPGTEPGISRSFYTDKLVSSLLKDYAFYFPFIFKSKGALDKEALGLLKNLETVTFFKTEGIQVDAALRSEINDNCLLICGLNPEDVQRAASDTTSYLNLLTPTASAFLSGRVKVSLVYNARGEYFLFRVADYLKEVGSLEAQQMNQSFSVVKDDNVVIDVKTEESPPAVVASRVFKVLYPFKLTFKPCCLPSLKILLSSPGQQWILTTKYAGFPLKLPLPVEGVDLTVLYPTGDLSPLPKGGAILYAGEAKIHFRLPAFLSRVNLLLSTNQ